MPRLQVEPAGMTVTLAFKNFKDRIHRSYQ